MQRCSSLAQRSTSWLTLESWSSFSQTDCETDDSLDEAKMKRESEILKNTSGINADHRVHSWHSINTWDCTYDDGNHIEPHFTWSDPGETDIKFDGEEVEVESDCSISSLSIPDTLSMIAELHQQISPFPSPNCDQKNEVSNSSTQRDLEIFKIENKRLQSLVLDLMHENATFRSKAADNDLGIVADLRKQVSSLENRIKGMVLLRKAIYNTYDSEARESKMSEVDLKNEIEIKLLKKELNSSEQRNKDLAAQINALSVTIEKFKLVYAIMENKLNSDIKKMKEEFTSKHDLIYKEKLQLLKELEDMRTNQEKLSVDFMAKQKREFHVLFEKKKREFEAICLELQNRLLRERQETKAMENKHFHEINAFQRTCNELESQLAQECTAKRMLQTLLDTDDEFKSQDMERRVLELESELLCLREKTKNMAMP